MPGQAQQLLQSRSWQDTDPAGNSRRPASRARPIGTGHGEPLLSHQKTMLATTEPMIFHNPDAQHVIADAD
jgi:hypothetical protein